MGPIMTTKLKRPIVRRIGNLVVRIDAEGVAIRGHRKRTWRRLPWPELAAAAGEARPILRACDRELGAEHLAQWGAQPDAEG